MKKIFLFTIPLLLLLTSSCQDAPPDKNELLKSIASDELYIEYQKIFDQHKINIGIGIYDMGAIKNFVDNKPSGKYKKFSLCDESSNQFLYSSIKGGSIYANMQCEMMNVQKKLTMKYPDYPQKMELDDLNQIQSIYRENIGNKYPASEAIITHKMNQNK